MRIYSNDRALSPTLTVCVRARVCGQSKKVLIPPSIIYGQDALLCANLHERGILNQFKRQWDYCDKRLGSAARAP